MIYAKIYLIDDNLIIETINYDIDYKVEIAKEFSYNGKKVLFPMTTITPTTHIACSKEAMIVLKELINNSEKVFEHGELAIYVEKCNRGNTFAFKPLELYHTSRVFNRNDKIKVLDRFGLNLDALNDFVIMDNDMLINYKFIK